MPSTEHRYRNDMHLTTLIVKDMLARGVKPLADGTYFVASNEPIGDFRLRPAGSTYQRKFEARWKARGRTRRDMHCYFMTMKQGDIVL